MPVQSPLCKKNQYRNDQKIVRTVATILSVMLIPSILWGAGEPPDFVEKPKSKLIKINKSKKDQVKNSNLTKERAKTNTPLENGTFQEHNVINDLSDLEEGISQNNQTKDHQKMTKKLNKLIKLKQFDTAYITLQNASQNYFTKDTLKMKKKLKLFYLIEKKASENTSMFGKDESLDEVAVQATKRLYREAQVAYLGGALDLSKDLLIQTLFLNRRHFQAKQLMRYGLKKTRDAYKIENLENKYWKTSLTSIYSGYPERALKDLEVLSYFDPENPLIFERMGSAYYSMGKPKDAIQAWKRTLYLDPQNKELKIFITNAEKEEKRQSQELKRMLNQKKKKNKKETDTDVKMQVLGVYESSNSAYSFAQEVRQQLKTDSIVVKERIDGKWEVSVPQNQPTKEVK